MSLSQAGKADSECLGHLCDTPYKLLALQILYLRDKGLGQEHLCISPFTPL